MCWTTMAPRSPALEMEAWLNDWCKRFTIVADAFAGMGWVTEVTTSPRGLGLPAWRRRA
jgi:hypothetical protein